MSIRLVFKDRQMGAKFKVGQKRGYQAVLRASGATARQAAAEIKSRGDRDITSAGRFGSRWTRSFHSTTLLSGDAYTVKTYSDIFYFNVFELGKVIHGRPLLWIPLSFAKDAQGIRARDFPGGLFRVDRRTGAPLLLSIETREPKYFGKESVRIPKKFHIRAIARDVAKKLKAYYKRHIARG